MIRITYKDGTVEELEDGDVEYGNNVASIYSREYYDEDEYELKAERTTIIPYEQVMRIEEVEEYEQEVEEEDDYEDDEEEEEETPKKKRR